MSVEQRRALIEPEHDQLSTVRQCALVSISRSLFYHPPVSETAEILEQKPSDRNHRGFPNTGAT